ncbi:MAG TPA: hypothetical protein VM261_29715 [Kofleriaceae bacterium]|nr:hypothetical protein [Kofleriaceae bacterium]
MSASREERGQRARDLALALALAFIGACRGGDAASPRASTDESLSIVIHAGRDTVMPGRAHVDERRWRDVPARGELELGVVASGLELDSVVVESESDPGALTTRSCDVVAAGGGLGETAWLWGRTVAVVTDAGARIEGVVVDVGDPMALIADDETETRGLVPRESVRADAEELPAHAGPPRVGDAVSAIDRDGRELYGTFVAVVPERLVVRAAGGKVTSVAPERVLRISVEGVPAQPTLRCEVESRRPGRHLVRVTYATTGVTWSAGHTIASLPAGDAPGAVTTVELQTAYTVTAEALPAPRAAHVQLVLGLPGESEPPVTVWRGDATIGGRDGVRVQGAPGPRRARVDRVYRGAEEDPAANPRRPEWRDASTSSVWRELAFERTAADAPGPVRVAVRDGGVADAVLWVDGEIPAGVATAGVATATGAIRVPLRLEPDLVGFRRKLGRDLAGQVLVDEVSYSVANRGDAAVEVLVEEPLRGTVRPSVVYEKEAGELLRDRWRAHVTVPAGGIVQGRVVLQYRFKRY